ncbi:MAG: hypothetical protein AABZ74_09650 [Cyanobacteriota bacterium]
MNKIKKIHLKISLILVILLNICSCFVWNKSDPNFEDIGINLDTIDKNEINQLINAPSEITFDNKIYILSSGVSKTNHYPLREFFYINVYPIYSSSTKDSFFNNFSILVFYMINKNKKFYFSSKNIDKFNKFIDDIGHSVEILQNNYIEKINGYKEDKNDIFIIKLKDNNNNIYFLRSKTENEESELRIKLENFYKKKEL